MTNNLPNSWQIKTLGEISRVITGKTPSKSHKEYFGGTIPFVKPSDLDKKTFIDTSEDTLTELGFKHAPFIPKNSVLVSCIGNLGKKAILSVDGSCNQQLNAIIPNENLDYKFLYYQIDIIKFWMERNASATTVTILNKSKFEKAPIILPPLEIQKRIVARLESAFEKIEKGSAHLQDAKTKLAKYKQSLLKSAFNGTLTAAASLQGVEKAETIHTAPSLRESTADEAIHKVDCHKSANANFHNDDKSVDCHDLTSSNLAMTDKENPKLPQGWSIKTLGEVCEILDNMRKPINSTEREQRLKNSTTKYAYYGATGQVGYIDDFLCDFESILLGEDGAPFLEPFKDKAYIVSGKYWVNNHAHILKAKENFAINKFVCYFLNIVDYMPYVSGTTRLKLNQSAMKQIKIPLPPLETQKQIVKLLEKHLQHADKTGEFIESALNKAKQLKQSLLKSAFLGKLT